jgi:hypothetical protein
MELVKQATWSDTPVELFFYRDTEKREVDLVIESVSGDVVGIETKAAASGAVSDTRGLRLLRDRLGARFKAGIVVYSGEHTIAFGDRIWFVPLSGLWHASTITSRREAEFARLEAQQKRIQGQIEHFGARDRVDRDQVHARAIR